MSSYRYQSHQNPSKKNLMIGIGAIAIAGAGLGLYALLSIPIGSGNAEAEALLVEATEFAKDDSHYESLEKFEEYLVLTESEVLPEDAAIQQLHALEETSQYGELVAASEAFLEAYPDSRFTDQAELYNLTSEVQVSGLTRPGLIQSLEEFLREHPDHKDANRLELTLARHEVTIGDYEAAKRRFGYLGTDPSVEPGIAQTARREMGNLNLDELLTGSPSDARYTVQSGDSIWKIARDLDVTQELLMLVNRIDDPSRLRVGQELRVPNTDFSIVCDVSRNEMILYNHGQFLKSYTVRTGREPGATPEGTFKVLNKKTSPTWRPGNGDVYLPGDPNNELGSRWMAFEGDILGIHGTIHPETLGAYASNGCIGMSEGDVEEIFDLILVGTPLTISGQQDVAYAPIIPAPAVPSPLSETEIAQLAP